MTDRALGHCLEFHMVHDPRTGKVRLTMVASAGGQVFRYEGEGTYHRVEHEPRVALDVQSEPIEFDLGDGFRNYVPGPATATAKCTVGELRFTKPITRTVLPEATDD